MRWKEGERGRGGDKERGRKKPWRTLGGKGSARLPIMLEQSISKHLRIFDIKFLPPIILFPPPITVEVPVTGKKGGKGWVDGWRKEGEKKGGKKGRREEGKKGRRERVREGRGREGWRVEGRKDGG